MKATLPLNEKARLQALKQFEILDTADEMTYDDLVVLAASICQTPMACISFVDEHRQWFKARIGLGFRDSDRDSSFCAHTILKPEQIMIIPDTRHDPRFADNDLVLGKPHIRFYVGVALVSPEGFPLGCLCVMDKEERSITVDQVEMLRALARQVVGQLELRRAKTTIRQQADNLLKAKENSVVAEDAKNNFLSNISHEFRTPINGIVGVASLLGSTPLSDRQMHFVETIERSADGLLKVLSNILEFSKNEVGIAGPNVSRVNLHGVLNDISVMMRPMAISKQIRFDVKMDDKLKTPVMGDELRLRQILANLVGNALKFTTKGFVELNVSQVSDTPAGAIVRFEIKDSGIGIPMEFQSAIFNEFAQVEQGPERSYGGTGLGLAICRQLAKVMGSKINLTSEPGNGSTFWFDLLMPFEQAYFNANTNDLPQRSQSLDSQKKVLIVEENEVNTIVLTSMLEKNGCMVKCVRNGVDALNILERERFNLVFMDVQMPDMEGVQTTRAIRKLSFPACTVPIVALTASVLREDEALCKSSGMNDFISKPVSEKVISGALKRWLSPAESKALL